MTDKTGNAKSDSNSARDPGSDRELDPQLDPILVEAFKNEVEIVQPEVSARLQAMRRQAVAEAEVRLSRRQRWLLPVAGLGAAGATASVVLVLAFLVTNGDDAIPMLPDETEFAAAGPACGVAAQHSCAAAICVSFGSMFAPWQCLSYSHRLRNVG